MLKVLSPKLPPYLQGEKQHRLVHWGGQFLVEVTVTPDLATQILDGNTENRRVKGIHANKIISAMTGGYWNTEFPQFIYVSSDGVVRDGQHRLLAIEASGVSVPLIVVFGSSPETQLFIDKGAVRSLRDNMAIMQKQGMFEADYSAQNVADALSVVSWFATGSPQSPTESIAVKIMEKMPDFPMWVKQASGVKGSGLTPAGVGGTAAVMSFMGYHGVAKEMIAYFNNEAAVYPGLVWHKIFVSATTQPKGVKLDRATILFWLKNGVKASLERKNVKQLTKPKTNADVKWPGFHEALGIEELAPVSGSFVRGARG